MSYEAYVAEVQRRGPYNVLTRTYWEQAPKPIIHPKLGVIMTDADRIQAAIDIAVQHGGHDGAHHKDWVIDQMVRELAGDRYDKIVAEACNGEDGPETYTWETGIAP